MFNRQPPGSPEKYIYLISFLLQCKKSPIIIINRPINAGILNNAIIKPNTANRSPPWPKTRISIPRIIKYLVNLLINNVKYYILNETINRID